VKDDTFEAEVLKSDEANVSELLQKGLLKPE